mmetsp:Transcript_39159/g.101251  ORF Transcript_39159/g.101251 Transcript_39159/m.101251 type:complete len:144 (-) Transcript_39159:315-746(-)
MFCAHPVDRMEARRDRATGGGCHERYQSPESRHFDPPCWTSLTDAKVVGFVVSPLGVMSTVPANFAMDVRSEDHCRPESDCPLSSESEARDRSSSENSELGTCLRVSSMDKVDSNGNVMPRRWMRGKRGGAKHRSSNRSALQA